MKATFADIMKEVNARRPAKLASKVPVWADAGVPSLPTDLCLEQCSSQRTALYKAGVAATVCGAFVQAGQADGMIADLTGGLGVDSWAFSMRFREVVYNEIDEALAAAARENFTVLGRANVTVQNIPAAEALERMGPDSAAMIYLDPARRAVDGKKVFRVEDCQPDVLAMKSALLEKCAHVMVKLSPMADVTALCRAFGQELTAVHIVEREGDCKELLAILERGGRGLEKICVASLCDEGDKVLCFHPSDREESAVELCPCEPSGWLFEPGPALMKAACRPILDQPYGLLKLGVSTHLFCCREIVEELKAFGKFRPILRTVPFSGSAIKALGREYPRCEVTARNIPVTSEELRKKMGSASGGDTHIYATMCDAVGRVLIICANR